jgi:hypothetical protein
MLWGGALFVGAGAIYLNYENLRNKFWGSGSKTVLNVGQAAVDVVQAQVAAYEYKGLDTLGEYEVADVGEERLIALKTIYISETTPDGNVIMNYNHETENFEYFSDNTIAYKYLETVARLYVMENNCCSIFVVLWDELKAGWRKMKGLDASGNAVVEEEEKEVAAVFASLKNYKKDEAAKTLIIDKSNTYKHIEKIGVYDEMIYRKSQKPVEDEEEKLITFTEWKKTQN